MLGVERRSRFSLISMVWCASHAAHAALPMWAKMRLPSSPGHGTKSRPSVSPFLVFAVDGAGHVQSSGPGALASSSLRIGAGMPSATSSSRATQRSRHCRRSAPFSAVPRQRSGCSCSL